MAKECTYYRHRVSGLWEEVEIEGWIQRKMDTEYCTGITNIFKKWYRYGVSTIDTKLLGQCRAGENEKTCQNHLFEWKRSLRLGPVAVELVEVNQVLYLPQGPRGHQPFLELCLDGALKRSLGRRRRHLRLSNFLAEVENLISARVSISQIVCCASQTKTRDCEQLFVDDSHLLEEVSLALASASISRMPVKIWWDSNHHVEKAGS